ncbi:hypothetical protein ACHAPA_010252 [Fusarium lateritium]
MTSEIRLFLGCRTRQLAHFKILKQEPSAQQTEPQEVALIALILDDEAHTHGTRYVSLARGKSTTDIERNVNPKLSTKAQEAHEDEKTTEVAKQEKEKGVRLQRIQSIGEIYFHYLAQRELVQSEQCGQSGRIF